MTIGEKIRTARQEAGLSQRQLCGEQVTRNMLSQIENGSARPSMDTLTYFAAQLGKPVSFFLDENALTSPNQAIMLAARAAYAADDFDRVLTVLKDYQSPDEIFDAEKGLLQNLCLLSAARQAQQRGQVPLSHQLLDRVDKKNLYYAAIHREHHLTMGIVPPVDDRELLLRAENALSGGDAPRALTYLAAVEDRENDDWNLLCGNVYFARGDYQNALPHLQKAEHADPKGCLSAMEVCYREMGDYENAYRCACKLREL